MRFVLLKRELVTTHGSHFAGGKHAFLCLSETLRDDGHEVHVVTISSKAQLLVASASGGRPSCDLFRLMSSPAAGPGLPQVVTWSDAAAQGVGSLSYHAVLKDSDPQGSAALVEEGVMQAITECFSDESGQNSWILMDADDSQVSEPSTSGTGSSGGCLFASVVSRWGRRCIASVQNVHFLPFGPSGTAPRSERLLQAWSQLGGVICVSHFVRGYLLRWAPSGTFPDQLSQQDHQQQQDQQQLQEQQHDQEQQQELACPWLKVVALSAWNCFGSPPFADWGSQVAEELAAAAPAMASEAPAAAEAAVAGQEGGGAHERKHRQPAEAGGRVAAVGGSSACALRGGSVRTRTVGVLKLTPEKGLSIVLELARSMPGLRFLAVAGDPKVQRAVVQAGMGNLEIVEPVSDIDHVLCKVSVVLAPSLWYEAWGMVVTEALLRGLPCIVSDAGGLPEAGVGLSRTVPVVPITIPPDEASGVPDWGLREYPRQQVDPWKRALEEILGLEQQGAEQGSCADSYRRLSQRGRDAALAWLHCGIQERRSLIDWLGEQHQHQR